MNVRLRNPSDLIELFTGDLEDVNETVRNVSMLFDRLIETQDTCVGLRVKIADTVFVVLKEGDSLVLEAVRTSSKNDAVSGEFFLPHLANAY